jgi:hypothetical protein
MTRILDERVTAHIDGDFVVFLIGMRINKPWKVHKWLPVLRAMPKILKELEAAPESGFLGHTGLSKIIVQYWRSFDHLETYARNKSLAHWPAWVDFNKRLGASRGDVGIWHETYVVSACQYETVYSGMPPFGLGAASKIIPATGNRNYARNRLSVAHTMETNSQ